MGSYPVLESDLTLDLQAMVGLEVEIVPQSWGALLALRRPFDRPAYDAAYLALTQATSQPLITGDERLYNAVHAHLDWVLWIKDYKAEEAD